MNGRIKLIVSIIFTIIIITLIVVAGITMDNDALKADFSLKNMEPSVEHPFGTDWMGRDMLARTIKGLSISIVIGLVASFVSAIMAVIVGALAGTMPKWVDDLLGWFIDLVMGIPHLILLILISFVVGRGIKGVMIGIAVTHWTSLARLIRSEVLQIRGEFYIKLSRKLGKGNIYILKNHILPHLLPQIIIGFVLLFPHAILHEAAVTFLGFGLSPEVPAVGIILSESMKYLSAGRWYLALFPGLSLVAVVLLFEYLGDNIKKVLDPYNTQN